MARSRTPARLRWCPRTSPSNLARGFSLPFRRAFALRADAQELGRFEVGGSYNFVPTNAPRAGVGYFSTSANCLKSMAPRARFELATLRLTAECSTIELPGNSTAWQWIVVYVTCIRSRNCGSQVSTFAPWTCRSVAEDFTTLQACRAALGLSKYFARGPISSIS